MPPFNHVSISITQEATRNAICPVRHNCDLTAYCNVLSCCRYITPPGTGFLPRETALHHQQHVTALVQEALDIAELKAADISAIAYTKVSQFISECTASVTNSEVLTACA